MQTRRENIKMWLIKDKKQNKWLLSHIDQPGRQNNRNANIVNINNIKQLIIACTLYADDHNGLYPGKLQELKDYINDENIYHFETADKKKIKYIYVAGIIMKNVEDSAQTILIYSPVVKNGKRLCGFVDAHVGNIDEKEFQKQAKAQKIKGVGAPPKLSKKESARIEALIKDLGHESFKKRKAAKEALVKVSWEAKQVLEKHKNSKDIEVRSAIIEILKGK